jgi:hypothetical protein
MKFQGLYGDFSPIPVSRAHLNALLDTVKSTDRKTVLGWGWMVWDPTKKNPENL